MNTVLTLYFYRRNKKRQDWPDKFFHSATLSFSLNNYNYRQSICFSDLLFRNQILDFQFQKKKSKQKIIFNTRRRVRNQSGWSRPARGRGPRERPLSVHNAIIKQKGNSNDSDFNNFGENVNFIYRFQKIKIEKNIHFFKFIGDFGAAKRS